MTNLTYLTNINCSIGVCVSSEISKKMPNLLNNLDYFNEFDVYLIELMTKSITDYIKSQYDT